MTGGGFGGCTVTLLKQVDGNMMVMVMVMVMVDFFCPFFAVNLMLAMSIAMMVTRWPGVTITT